MSFCLFYNGQDAQIIQDCYQAARSILAANDRFNIDACWNAGLSAWANASNLVYTAATDTWSDYCRNPYPSGPVDRALCDKETHLIVISGTWTRTVSAYGAVNGAQITKAGFVGLMKRMGAADPDTTRGNWIIMLADDVANTAREPFP